MTEHEVAREIWQRFGLDLPTEGRIANLYGIGSDRAGQALEMAKDIATMRALSYFGGASFEPVKEWRR